MQISSRSHIPGITVVNGSTTGGRFKSDDFDADHIEENSGDSAEYSYSDDEDLDSNYNYNYNYTNNYYDEFYSRRKRDTPKTPKKAPSTQECLNYHNDGDERCICKFMEGQSRKENVSNFFSKNLF